MALKHRREEWVLKVDFRIYFLHRELNKKKLILRFREVNQQGQNQEWMIEAIN